MHIYSALSHRSGKVGIHCNSRCATMPCESKVCLAISERTYGQEARGKQSIQEETTAAREGIRQRSLETHAGVWQAQGEIHCRCPRRPGLRSISLICPNRPTRICSTRWHKSSLIPSAVLPSYGGSTGAISPDLVCACRTKSTSSTPTRLLLWQ